MYVDMADEEKLESESFERLPAGVSIASESITAPTTRITGNLDYETRYLGSFADQIDDTRVTFPIHVLTRHAGFAAVARSDLRRNRFLADAVIESVSAVAPAYRTASVDTLGAGGPSTIGGTYAQASQTLRREGSDAGALQVVEAYELDLEGVS
jgi:hypothetical protein